MQLQGGTMQGPPVCVSIKYNEIEPENSKYNSLKMFHAILQSY